MSAADTALGNVPDSRAQWTLHLGVLAALIVLILVEFQFEVVNAVVVWWVYPTYSHCFLIIPISLWLIWEKRDELGASLPSVTAKGLLAIPFVLLFWFAAKIATINEARQFAVIGLVQIAILTMVGTHIYRKILFPALYLFFLVPTGQYLIPQMQVIATWFADTGLTLFGVPHYTEGTLIELATGRFEVAEACAGLRFLIATMTLGVLYAHLTYRKWYKIALFLASCVVVPLVGNGLRCLGIIMLAYMTNNEVAVGADHLVYGWFFNVAIMIVLFFAGLRFRDPPREEVRSEASDARPVSRMAVLLLAAATALAASIGPALAYWRENRPIVMNSVAFERPLELNGWRTIPGAKDWSPSYANPDAEFAASLTQDSSNAPAVDLAIIYYSRMREGRSLIASTNDPWDPEMWHRLEAHAATARIGGSPARFSEAVIASRSERRLVWSSYWLDGRFTLSGMTIKLLQLKTALTGNEGAALVAVSTPIDGPLEDARLRIRNALAALDMLPERLAEAGQTGNIQKASR